MILEKSNIRRVIAIVFLGTLYSCNGLKTDLPQELIYYKFSHVMEVVDSSNDGISGYKLDTIALTMNEANHLANILTKEGKMFYRCDSNIFISKSSIGDITEMYLMDGELNKYK